MPAGRARCTAGTYICAPDSSPLARDGSSTSRQEGHIVKAPIRVACEDRPGQGSRLRLGVADFNPVQYRTPLYQLISRRARVELDVLFLTDNGHMPFLDPGFGVPVTWDIDLLSGYGHQFLTTSSEHSPARSRMARLSRWIAAHD